MQAMRAAYEQHQLYMTLSENLRIQQEAQARGRGLVLAEDAVLTSGDDAKSNSPTSSASSATSMHDALEESAEKAQHESIPMRVYRALTSFNLAEGKTMLLDFTADPEVNRYVLTGSVASAASICCQVSTARAIGNLYDALTSSGAVLTSAVAIPDTTVLSAASSPHLERGRFAILLLCILAASLLERVCNVVKDYAFARARAARVVASRKRYLSAMLAQDLTFHGVNKSSELSQRLQSDPDALDDAAVHSLERLLRGLTALAYGATMFFEDWRMLALGVALRLPFALQYIEKSIYIVTSYDRLTSETLRKAHARASESLSHVVAVQAHTAEESEVRGYAALLSEHVAVRRHAAGVASLLRQTESTFYAFSDLITLAFGAWRIYRGTMSLGAFTASRSTMQVVIDQFNHLEGCYVGLRQAAIQSRKYYALLSRVPALADAKTPSDTASGKPEKAIDQSITAAASAASEARNETPIEDRTGLRNRHAGAAAGRTAEKPALVASPAVVLTAPSPRTALTGTLRFEDVSFAYPSVLHRAARQSGGPAESLADVSGSRLVLDSIAFEAHPGKVVALVGPSGSGKSTVARLCMRFFDVTAGRVTLDGCDVRSLPLRDLRRAIGVVDQDSSLLDRTVYENLTLGLEDDTGRAPVTMEEVEAAARAAEAHDFIVALPQGYRTCIGERGSRLSGGQRQRLQIARALLRDPRMLILDEATSALDAENEALVTAALSRLMAGRTTIVIAHRLSVVRRADVILVMSKGGIVERGSHDAILREHPGGLYARLLAHQSHGGPARPPAGSACAEDGLDDGPAHVGDGLHKCQPA